MYNKSLNHTMTVCIYLNRYISTTSNKRNRTFQTNITDSSKLLENNSCAIYYF